MSVLVATIALVVGLTAPSGSADPVSDGDDVGADIEPLLARAGLDFEDGDAFVIVPIRTPTGYTQNVYVSKTAFVIGDVAFIEITALGWVWEDATEFSRANANWLLKASSEAKVGAWQALVFENKGSIAAEFKATVPLESTPSALEATIRAVASSAFHLHDIMDR